MSPEVTARLQVLRQRSIAGTITMEEMKEAIRLMREDRETAQASATAPKKGKKASSAAINSDDLLKELEGL